MVVAAVLTIVGRIRAAPRLVVHGAVLALRHAVLVQDVRIEEAAEHPAAEVLDVPLRLGFAGGGAAGHVERLAVVEELVAHVAVVLVAVERGVDGGLAVVLLRVARHVVDQGADVAVGAGDDDVEVLAPLAVVHCGRRVDRAAPPDAFDDGGAGGVGACRGRVDAWVTLEVCERWYVRLSSAYARRDALHMLKEMQPSFLVHSSAHCCVSYESRDIYPIYAIALLLAVRFLNVRVYPDGVEALIAMSDSAEYSKKSLSVSVLGEGPEPRGCWAQASRRATLPEAGWAATEAKVLEMTLVASYETDCEDAPSPIGTETEGSGANVAI